MRFYIRCFFGLWIIFFVACTQEKKPDLPDTVDFNFHIKPILSDRCFPCHGPDENTREANLALHLQEHLFKSLMGSDKRYIVDPGNVHRSELFSRIESKDTSYQMPPPASNTSMSNYEIAIIKKWIRQGAEWKSHWAFISPKKSNIGSEMTPIREMVDLLIRKKLKQEGLRPNPSETKEKWLRRVSFDLTGLPPTTEQLNVFVNNPDPKAFENEVDRLLATPAYGEKMASTWLDLSRYADSHGYQDDRPRTMWPWRDWVIDAFNQNLPYDQFATWQLAGDLLPNPTFAQKLATGFNRNHAITQEGGVINEEYLTEYAADRTNTFANTFLGLTMECARCHDHKFDPISQEEYYQLFGFFNNVKNERGQVSYFDLAPEPSIPFEDINYQKYVDSINRQKQLLLLRKDQWLATYPPKTYNEWKKTDSEEQPWIESAYKNQIVHFPLDDGDAFRFANRVPDQPTGRTNLNLPPLIAKPDLVPGHMGKALRFNGDNFLTMGEVGDFEYYDQFSVGVWIKHTRKHTRTAGMISRRNGEQKRQGYDLSIEKDGKINVRLIHHAGRHQIHVQTRYPVSANRWHQVIFTYDGSGDAKGIKIFINGIIAPAKILSNTLDGRSILNGNDLLAGHWNHRARKLKDLYGFEGGSIDEIRVYNKTLSALEVKELFSPGATRKSVSERDLTEYFQLYHDTALLAIEASLFHYRSLDISIPDVMIMEERDSIKPTYILSRGAYDAPTVQVSRGTPKEVLPFDPALSQNRLGLAKWLFDARHPLTARVLVNRLWQHCFGHGLVKTPADFGYQGDLPTHPDLLDHLAVEMLESGWNVKAMLKELVLSETYRQSSKVDTRSFHIDPDNRYLSRGPNKRLSAEMLRDQVLAISGLLVPQVGGKWVKPYQPPGIWKEMANQIGENKYRVDRGASLYRRSLYTYWKRTIPPPTLTTLDAPERAVCTPKRQTTSTPLQALILMNDPQYVEAARFLANQLLRDNEDTWIEHAFYQITSRKAAAHEIQTLSEYYTAQYEHYISNPEKAVTFLTVGAYKSEDQIPEAKLAAATMVVNTIFNLDESKYY